MAEIISRNKNSKKIIPRVDLTPMVDLGFLLITFFIVTTSMTTQKAMPIALPLDGSESKYEESKTLNLVLGSNDKIFYYTGNDSLHAIICNYQNTNGIRSLIIEKQQQVQQKFGNKKELLVLIKPTTKSSYKNVVDALDEMKINAVSRYMIVATTKFEENW